MKLEIKTIANLIGAIFREAVVLGGHFSGGYFSGLIFLGNIFLAPIISYYSLPKSIKYGYLSLPQFPIPKCNLLNFKRF